MSINDEFPEDDRPKRRRFDGNDGYDDQGAPEQVDRLQIARSRTNIPGIFLAVCGILSVLIGAFVLIRFVTVPEEEMIEAARQQKQRDPNNPMQPEEMARLTQNVGIGGGVVWVVTSLPIIIGGFQMRQLKGYYMGMAGSVLAMIPCCTNGCMMLSLPVGIWAMVVLLNEDVKWGFRRMARPIDSE